MTDVSNPRSSDNLAISRRRSSGVSTPNRAASTISRVRLTQVRGPRARPRVVVRRQPVRKAACGLRPGASTRPASEQTRQSPSQADGTQSSDRDSSTRLGANTTDVSSPTHIAQGSNALPGTEQPRRLPPRGLRYELISCGLSGHELVGTDAAELRDQDALFAREADGLRWYRCLRCDAWLPQTPPQQPARRHPPELAQIELPLRGRPLRDKYVLRLIALDRAVHFLVLGILAVAIFAVLNDRLQLRHEFFRIVSGIQAGVGGVASSRNTGIVGDVGRVLSLRQSTLYAAGFVFAAYALLEGVEAVGLWLRKRWAEYLTFIATTLLLIPEIYELTKSSRH